MYLKRLDAQGFKSFASKTGLEFAPGVTCIIGPNGTGKTNVADALRWVLGEHASRTLRARKTEDVIFAGSDKRAPMGAAEVNITLDNSGHWLPIDYEEVVVSRRAYRNGENEYLINNAKVRLRDVVELFMRAQVGQNSYAFMGQGMVEQVLSLRPEDRRGLIEEAADVRLYRNKLEDARTKLKATRDNMERVRMLVREIEPRITQLERQAGRAVRYQELTRELANALHAWFGHQWRDVNEQVLASIAALDQRTGECADARAAAKACEDGLAQLRAAIDERRHEMAAREGRLRSLQDYANDLERRAALDGERSRMLSERIEELTLELQALRAEEAALQAIEPAPETAEIEERLSTERAQLAEERARLATVEGELRSIERAALAEEHAASRARALGDDAARRATEAGLTLARIDEERGAAAVARGEAIGELARWARAYAADAAALAGAVRDAEAAATQRARAAAALAGAQRQHAALEEEVRALRTEAAAARMRLDLIQQMDVRPQAPDAGVRAILEAGGIIRRETVSPDIELAGVKGLVGQIIRVGSGMEKAIEAALADNLFAIVFERHADMRAAVDLLLGGDQGRATMYALDSFQESRPLHLIKERGVHGVASSMVRCEGRYRRLVDTLLGRTVVVDDLAVAQRFIRRGLAHAVATVDGVLLRPVGAVSAGSLASVAATFGHTREIEDLPAQLALLDPQIDEREQNLSALAARRDEAEAELAAVDMAEESLRTRRAAAEMAVGAARGRLMALRARFAAFAADARRRDDDAARAVASRDRASAERDASTREALAAEEREQAARRTMAELMAARTQLADAIAERAAVVAQFDGQLRSDRQLTEGERSARERLARQIEAKDTQRANMLQESQTLVTRLDATRRELADKVGEIGSLRQELEPAARELAQFESRERTLSAEVIEASGRQRDAERALADAEHEVRLRQDELQALRLSLEEEGFVTTGDGDVQRVPAPPPSLQDASVGTVDGDAEGDVPGWMRDSGGGPDLPPMRGGSTINPTELRDRIAELRGQIRGLGPVNEQAASDYTESRERYDFLTTQLADLQQADAQLSEAVDELEVIIRDKFRTTFKVVNREFERYFSAFFRGGTARLELGETDEDGMPGIDIYAQPPGKKLGSLALLSGGERSLTAVALLFALLQANPSPICVLDEVDAALDEANVGRFVEELRALAERTQFIIITHNRRTIETADTIYGVSMGADNVSRVLSLKLSDVPEGDD